MRASITCLLNTEFSYNIYKQNFSKRHKMYQHEISTHRQIMSKVHTVSVGFARTLLKRLSTCDLTSTVQRWRYCCRIDVSIIFHYGCYNAIDFSACLFIHLHLQCSCTFTFTCSHLADAFVQSDVQGREQSSYEQ